jgi:hypothetical protein
VVTLTALAALLPLLFMAALAARRKVPSDWNRVPVLISTNSAAH